MLCVSVFLLFQAKDSPVQGGNTVDERQISAVPERRPENLPGFTFIRMLLPVPTALSPDLTISSVNHKLFLQIVLLI